RRRIDPDHPGLESVALAYRQPECLLRLQEDLLASLGGLYRLMPGVEHPAGDGSVRDPHGDGVGADRDHTDEREGQRPVAALMVEEEPAEHLRTPRSEAAPAER